MLVLASGSPRRVELIQQIVPEFQSLSSDIEELGSDKWPDFEIAPLQLAPPFPVSGSEDPRLWAWRKANDVALIYRDRIEPGMAILGADTVVVGPGRTLGKPRDGEDAISMLALLRGDPHYVVTAFVVLRATNAEPVVFHHEAVISKVFMRAYDDHEIAGYVATGEPFDKAGAYALQGQGGKLVSHVEGCINNVVGLPVCQVRRALVAAGEQVLPYPNDGFCEHCPLAT